MELKEIGPQGGGARPWRPHRSANGICAHISLIDKANRILVDKMFPLYFILFLSYFWVERD